MTVPAEIKHLRQWSYSYSFEERKRPQHDKYEPNGALTYDEAKTMAGSNLLVGFYTTMEDAYVLGDIDHIVNVDNPFAELPVKLAVLLRQCPTYMEVSPSGQGLRFLYKISDPDGKTPLAGKIFYIKEAEVGAKREVQINVGPPWMTITGKRTPYAQEGIAPISLAELEEVFQLKFKTDTLNLKPKYTDRTKLPGLSELTTCVTSLPLDQNPRIKRAYEKTFKNTYQHYDYWMKVLMGLHHYAIISDKMIECLEIALKWSRKDVTAFKSEEDVTNHWKSLTDKDTIVSYRTLFSLYYNSVLRWPVPKKPSKQEEEKNIIKPIISEYVNFKALLDYYNISIYRDERDRNLVYLSGDTDILNKYFMMHGVDIHYGIFYGPFNSDYLLASLHMFLQRYGFTGISHGTVNGFIKNILAETLRTVNLLKIYFDTPLEQLPEKYQENIEHRDTSTFDALFQCLKLDYMTDQEDMEYELYYTYYKAWLMGLVRNLYYSDHMHSNNCILLLTGREQIRKTSHFRFILPTFMREYVAFTTHSFSSESNMRDVVKLSSSNLMIVWDEIEQYLTNQTEPNFKKIIDNVPQKFIDKYEVSETTIRPIAIYGATSNLREFKLGDEGSRRLFHIPVKWVDTERMSTICWHQVINELHEQIKKQFKKNKVAWLLTEEQLAYQRDLHGLIRAKNSLDIVLEDIFEFDKPIEYVDGGLQIKDISSIQADKTGRCLSTKQVIDMLMRYGYKGNITPVVVTKTLERICGKYTKTSRFAKQLARPNCEIRKGLAQQGPHKRWIFPPYRKNAIGGMFNATTT